MTRHSSWLTVGLMEPRALSSQGIARHRSLAPSTLWPGPSVSLRPQLPCHCLLLLSSEMRRCEEYQGTRDGLAGKMDEGAEGQEAPSAGRLAIQGGGCAGRHASMCGVEGGRVGACVSVHTHTHTS